jgi:hypothetical protein
MLILSKCMSQNRSNKMMVNQYSDEKFLEDIKHMIRAADGAPTKRCRLAILKAARDSLDSYIAYLSQPDPMFVTGLQRVNVPCESSQGCSSLSQDLPDSKLGK